MILSDAVEKIRAYDRLNLHYNLVAEAVYSARRSNKDLFGAEHLRFIVAALISFNIGRQIGKLSISTYEPREGGFAATLEKKLRAIRPLLQHLVNVSLCEVDLPAQRSNISEAYVELANSGKFGLHQQGKQFHVGATKILHFVNPELFLIIDSKTAQAFRKSHGVMYRRFSPQGYSAEKYLTCLEKAKSDIAAYGEARFAALQMGNPIGRIYDKLAFASTEASQ